MATWHILPTVVFTALELSFHLSRGYMTGFFALECHFIAHLYFREIYDFLCSRIHHKPFMKLSEKHSWLYLNPKCFHTHIVQNRANPGTIPQIQAHASWWELIHAVSKFDPNGFFIVKTIK